MSYNRSFIKKLEGFIEDSIYQRMDESGNIVLITIAIWQNAEALARAKAAVQAEYQRIGFNPAELLAKLNITMERDIYNDATA